MFSFLKKPYPYNSFSSKDILSNFLIGCFIAFFLIVFQPFGVPLWQTEYKTFKLIGFGFVSFICPLLFKLTSVVFLKKYNPEETWMVWKETLALLLVILFIAFGNLCYGNLIHINHFTIQELLLAMAATFLLAIFPITANVALKYNRFVMLNQKEAQLMEEEVLDFQQRLDTEIEDQTDKEEVLQKEERLVLIAENEKDILELKPEELLYIESADNYSNVIFLKNQQIAKQLIRGSLKRLESQISFPFIVRCHRSYIVNLKQVNHIKGNAQGYRIEFKTELSDTIPVSRNYSKSLFERLESLK
ncbi:MAG: LytTR family transcriptional regulator DNA-binding domain-containing protein [Bacteroidetes bacterium]|nr:LytTR family transcriptional regulator DNA-binding domain-containing protein [Bacteroidota bacterium]